MCAATLLTGLALSVPLATHAAPNVAVAGAIASNYRNTEQACVCANPLFVQSGIGDALAEKLAVAVPKLRIDDGVKGDANSKLFHRLWARVSGNPKTDSTPGYNDNFFSIAAWRGSLFKLRSIAQPSVMTRLARGVWGPDTAKARSGLVGGLEDRRWISRCTGSAPAATESAPRCAGWPAR